MKGILLSNVDDWWWRASEYDVIWTEDREEKLKENNINTVNDNDGRLKIDIIIWY